MEGWGENGGERINAENGGGDGGVRLPPLVLPTTPTGSAAQALQATTLQNGRG